MCSTDNGNVRVDNKAHNVSKCTIFESQHREDHGEKAFSAVASPISLEVRAIDPAVVYVDHILNSILETGKPLCIFAKSNHTMICHINSKYQECEK